LKGCVGEKWKRVAAEENCRWTSLFDRREEFLAAIEAAVQVGCEEAQGHDLSVRQSGLSDQVIWMKRARRKLFK